MGISGNMQSLSQLCACYGVPRVTQGFTTLFIGETFAVYKVISQLFHGSEANSNKPLKNEKIYGIERLFLPFPETENGILLP